MSDLERQLAELETRMGRLCAQRADRLAKAEAIKRQANDDFDRDALSLGRRIHVLRARIEAAQPSTPPKERVIVLKRSVTHDPDWSQEDIDHFYELQRRGNKTSA